MGLLQELGQHKPWEKVAFLACPPMMFAAGDAAEVNHNRNNQD
jgi:hypothetical protein